MLNLPEIPVPPRLSIFLKLLALLAFVTLLLLPVGIVYAQLFTRSRLRAAGLVPESFHDVQQFLEKDVPVVPCTTTCDSPLKCHAECGFRYTLLDESKGTIMKQNCSGIGLSTANTSLATPVGWNCSFDYAVNETAVDVKVSETTEWRSVMWATLAIAVFDSAAAALVLRIDRWIADKYMGATHGPRRDTLQSEHKGLRLFVIVATVVAFILAGLYGSAALYGMTFESFSAVDALSLPLTATLIGLHLGIGFHACIILIIAMCEH